MLKKGLILQIMRERHNVFAEEISKINLSLNGDKRLQSIDSVEMGTEQAKIYYVRKRDYI